MRAGIAGLVAVAALALASPAHAQLGLLGGTQAASTGGAVRGVDAAYDPVNNAYLVVGGAGRLLGIFVNAAGAPVSSPFVIAQPTPGTAFPYGAFPRVSYSPQAGGFLVAWTSEENGTTVMVRGRMVAYPGNMGPSNILSNPVMSWIDVGALDVAYSPTSQRFLVAWKSVGPTYLYGRMIDNNATPLGVPVALSTTFGRDPGVTWNAARNEFGVSFSGETDTTTYSGFVRVPAADITQFSRESFNSLAATALLTTATDIAYNPATGNYLMGWFELGPSGPVSKVAEFSGTGALLTTGIASTHGSYDAFSLDYNALSGTFLMVGVNRANDVLVGAELNRNGYRFAAEQVLSATHAPVRYPRVVANTEAAQWLSSFSAMNFIQVGIQGVGTSTTGGGPAGTYGSGGGGGGSTPPPTGGCTSVNPGPAFSCVNGNWVYTGGGTTTPPPSTGGCTSVNPGPAFTCVNGNWVYTGGGTTTPPPTTPTTPPPTTGCSTPSPGAGWGCVNGGWLPPGHPLLTSTPTTPPPTTPPPTTPPPTTGCSTASPGTGWVCVNGGWLPPGHPSIPPPCPTASPGTGWVCVNGGWLPPGHPSIPTGSTPPPTSGGGGGGLPACTGGQLVGRPVVGWIRLANGSWVPASHPLAAAGICQG